MKGVSFPRPGWLRRLRIRWQRARWEILSALGVLALLLGWIGFHRLPEDAGHPDSRWDGLYKALGLFLFEGGDLSFDIMPFTLGVARFLAPLVVFAAAVGTALSVFHREVQRFRARWRVKHHVVLVGLDARVVLLADRLVKTGRRCVIVDTHDVGSHSTWARLVGIPVVTNSETDVDLIEEADAADLLTRAGLRRAAAVVVITGSATLNARFASTLHNLRGRPGTPSQVLIEMDDIDSLRTTSGGSLQEGDLEWFSLADRAARSLLDQLDELLAVRTPEMRRHVVVVGRTAIGRSLVVQAIRNWSRDLGRLPEAQAGAPTETGKPSETQGRTEPEDPVLAVTLVSPIPSADGADGRLPLAHELRLLHRRDPRVPLAEPVPSSPIELDVIDWDVAREPLIDRVGRRPSAVVITADSDADLLRLSMDVAVELPDKVPVWLCAERSGGLIDIATGRDPRAAGPTVHVFHAFDAVLKEDRILRGVDEELARAVHQAHRRYRIAAGVSPDDFPSIVAWDNLSDEHRDLNHAAVAAWRRVLAADDFRFVPYTRIGAEKVVLPPDLLKRLAVALHTGWNETKKDQGYVRGISVNNDPQRGPLTHPDIDVPFGDLPARSQNWNWDQARLVPEHLAAAGLQLDPLPAG